MRVSQTVFGVFHHFELALQLERRGHLQSVFSTWPWMRLQREGLPRSKVQTFPWLHLPAMLLLRAGIHNAWLHDHLGYATALSFDRWTLHRLPADCQVLIAISGSSLATGRALQQRGGLFVCDRGSTHQRFQEQAVTAEFLRWKLPPPKYDSRDTVREEALYEQADAITIPSASVRRSFIQMGVPAAKLHVMPYGVRLDRFRPTDAPTAGRFDVIFVGQVGLRKGVPYLLEAFARLKHPAKSLTIVGNVLPEIRSLLSRLPLESVTFTGVLPQPEVAARLSRSHLLVLPSVEEGLALVQAQAMACACPVLATSATGSEDLYADGVEGFIVPPCSSDSLLLRMQQLADDEPLRLRLSHAALCRVQSLGGWDRYGDLWENLLRSLVRG